MFLGKGNSVSHDKRKERLGSTAGSNGFVGAIMIDRTTRNATSRRLVSSDTRTPSQDASLETQNVNSSTR